MPDKAEFRDPGAEWREQPEEDGPVNLEDFVHRRTHELYWSTRYEILASIAATLLFVGIVAWRLPPVRNPYEVAGFAAVIAWIAISLWWFRRRIWRAESEEADARAATGLEFYHRQLERRRDHLRNAWIWHGPLILAIAVFAATVGRHAYPERLRTVWPLLVVLAGWVAFGVLRRRRAVREIQREIEDLRRC
jgi:hypothetical protein